MTEGPEAIVRAFLQAQSNADPESIGAVLTDDFTLHGRDGLVRDRDAFLAGVGNTYDHLDDVFTLTDFTDGVARIRRELRWRGSGELSAHRDLTYRFTLRDDRVAKVELLGAAPWERR